MTIAHPRPQALAPEYDAVPEELRVRPQWIVWSLVLRNGHWAKVPRTPRGSVASVTEPSTWSDFDSARAAVEANEADGIGYVFSLDDPYCGWDFDAKNGTLSDESEQAARSLNSYTERSPGGKGLHVLIRAGHRGGGHKKGSLESYDRARYFTVTGEHIPSTPRTIEERQVEHDALHALVFGTRERPQSVALTTNGSTLSRLLAGDTANFKSHSEADFALVCELARHGFTPAEAEAAWVHSGLARAKTSREDYRQRTIETAYAVGGQKSASGLPELPTLDAFLKQDFPPRTPILGPIHSADFWIVAAAPGVGKTQLAVGLNKALACGEDWGHWKSHGNVSILHVDGEMAPHELQTRFRMQGLDLSSPIHMLSAIDMTDRFGLDRLNLGTAEGQAVLDHYVKRYDPKVIQLDNVMSLVSVPGTSVSSDEFWATVAPLFRRYRGEGRTVIVWDHTNDMGRVFGTKTKTLAANVVLILEKPKDHHAEDGCRFIARFDKARGLHGPIVRPFEAQLITGEAASEQTVLEWRVRPLENAQREDAWTPGRCICPDQVSGTSLKISE